MLDRDKSWMALAVCAVAGVCLAALPASVLGATPVTGWAIESTHGPTNLPPSVNQVENVAVNAVGGTFTLTYSGETTASLAYNATATEVQAKLEALTAIGAHNVKVTGGPGGLGGSAPYVAAFEGALGAKSLTALTANSGSLLLGAGETLTCAGGPTTAGKLSYQWLSDGEPIAGDTASTYTIGLGESGAAIQCETTALNAESPAAGSVAVSTPALTAVSLPATALPTPPASVAAPTGTVALGGVLTCAAGTWTSASTYTYQWLRNGSVIASTTGSVSTTNTYTLTSANVATPASFQCIVTGTNAGGGVAVASAAKNTTTAPNPTITATSTVSAIAVTTPTQGVASIGDYALNVDNNGAVASKGTVTVTDKLPAGVTTSATPTGNGWTCAPAGAGQIEFTCTSSGVVNPDGVSNPIEVTTVVPVVAEGTVLTNHATVSGGEAAEAASTSDAAKVSAKPAPFGIQSLVAQEYGEDGKLYTQAGGHPFAATASFRFNTSGSNALAKPYNQENLKDVEVELPPGIIGDPSSTPRCFTFGKCPPASIVGVVYLNLTSFEGFAGTGGQPIFNMVPPAGMAAQFKFPTLSPTITIDARVRSNGDYGLTAYSEDASEIFAVNAVRITFWGTPAARAHEPERNVFNYFGKNGNETSAPEVPFLANPTDCATEQQEPPVTHLKIDSWQHPGVFTEMSSTAPPVTDCGLLAFKPTISLEPETTQAGQPTGFGFGLRVPQSEVTGGLSTPELRDTTVTLPAGMGVSPSATGGLTACSEEQIAFKSLAPGECPLSSQVANVAIWTPLLTTQPTLRALTGTLGTSARGAHLTYREDEYECARGSWSGIESGHPLHFQWLRDGVPIAGAEKTVYVPGVADEGKAIQCEVTVGNAGGTTVAVSVNEAMEPYPSPLPPEVLLLPKMEGAESAGATDTCTTGAWSGSPTSYAYQWLRNGAAIAGAQSSTYALGAEDAGKVLQCQVTATNTGGSAIALSLAAGTVAPAPAVAPPLIEPPLKGRVYVGTPACSPCSSADVAEGRLVKLFLEAEGLGVRVKLPGSVSVNPANGQLTANFDANPQLPFEELRLNFKNGPRAPLANPQTCGAYTAASDLEPWSAPDPLDATPTTSFNVDFDGGGGACPATLPFNPTFSAGTISSAADGYSNFTATFERPRKALESEERSEQDFAGIQVHTPPGLLGKLTGVPLCGEPQASQGTCGPESQIGTTTVATGPGAHPLHLTGKVYITSGYKGAPFGLSIVVPSEAGPFRLAGTTGNGTVVVRAAITIDPNTAALTITADPLPQVIDGVILRLQEANVEVTRPNFIVNATNCAQQSIAATITGGLGAKREFSEPYAANGCANLPFSPSFKVSTSAQTSRANGASLKVNVSYPAGVSEANIKMVKVELPKQLPSRLTTLQKACLAATFEANPAACPSASIVGVVKALTPILPVPLEGPVYFVSHGGEAFPSLIVVLQGDGVRINLVGSTFISKTGITSSTFKTVPDAPVSSFELTLPRGPYSALAANGNFCTSKLVMPTTMEGQNGKVVKQATAIAVTGCAKAKAKTLSRAQKLAKALKACKKKPKKQRASCAAQARKTYGAKTAARKATKSNRRGK